MRTVLNLDDKLLTRALRRATERGMTLRVFLEEVLAAALAGPGPGFRLEWRTHRGRLVEGVNVADRDVLYNGMAQRS